jgi:hypothetical protein
MRPRQRLNASGPDVFILTLFLRANRFPLRLKKLCAKKIR